MEPPPPASIHLPRGAVFAGDFVVVRLLGQGGMGAVYQVQQRSTGMLRALKLMRPELVQDPKLRGRFAQEATVGSLITSEHAVKVITAGFDQETAMPYLVMEYLEGEGLDQVLARRGPMSPGEAREVFKQLCHGLAEAHARGIVHRDLKTENIFIARPNRADVPFTTKILDFGIAKLTSEATGASSSTQSLGTPRTMAPEQADARAPVTPATDVWALGLVAFTVLTGRHFWITVNTEGGTLQALVAELLGAPIPLASARAKELGVGPLPEGFDAWFFRCLQRDPRQRFASAAEAWEALSPVLEGASAAASPRSPVSNTLAFAATAPPTPLPPVFQAPTAAPAPPGTLVLAPTGGARAQTDFAGSTRASEGGEDARRPRRWWPAAAAAAVLGAAGLVGWATPREVYCRDARWMRDDIECLGPLTEAEARRRWRSFRVTRARGKARSTTLVNGSGFPVAGEDGLASWSYHYRSGAIERMDAFDVHGRLVHAVRHSADRQRNELLGPSGEPRLFPRGAYSAEEISYDAQRRPVRVLYRSSKGAPATDPEGAFGYLQRFDERGLVAELIVLGSDDKPSFDARWRQKISRVHDARGDLIEERYATTDGQPISSKEGCYRMRYERDEVGNLSRATCLDAEGKPQLNGDGFAGWSVRSDSRGNTLEVRWLGLDGATVLNADGVGMQQGTFDERGRLVESRNFLADGSPALDRQGAVGVKMRHDGRGDEVERVFLGANDRPAFRNDGYAISRVSHDELHRPVELRYLDPEGKPTLIDAWYASVRLVHDGSDNVIERHYLDAEGKPTLCDRKFASLVSKYDARRSPVEEAYLGVDGKPTRNDEWVSIVRRSYDDRGNEIETSYFGPDGRPTRHREGYSVVRTRYSERNDVVERAFFNPEGKPTWTRSGVARIRYKRDALGRLIEQSNHDPQGRLAPGDDGEAIERYRLDERGREVEKSFFDAFDKPTVSKREGYAIRRLRLDAVGRVVERAFFGVEGKPTKNAEGVAVVRITYDERGNEVETAFFDAEGQPTLDASGAAVIRTKRDPRGAIIEWAHFDTSGKPARVRQGYTVVRTDLDERGRQVAWAYFDGEGRPVRYRTYASNRVSYDARGHRAETTFHDEAGRLLKGPSQPIERYRHDERGNRVEQALFDDNRAPWADADGLHKNLFTYDERDLLVETRPHDAQGNPVRGFLVVRTRYDDRGNRVELSYHDPTGRLAPDINGVCVERLTRDERGRIVEQAFLDENLAPTTHRTYRAAVLRFVYDEWGRRREELRLDASLAVVQTLRFDDAGRPLPQGPGR